MRLFDSFARTHVGPSTYSEDLFAFLNRSAWAKTERIRVLLEEWFSRYPAEEKLEFAARIRTDFDAAFFELFIHEVFYRSGFRIEIHPDLRLGKPTRPDFRVTAPSGDVAIVEAVIATDRDAKEIAEEKRQNQLLDKLNEVVFPGFTLDVDILCLGHPAPSTRKLREFITAQLHAHSAEEILSAYRTNQADRYRWVFRDGDSTEIHIRPLPLDPDRNHELDIPAVGMLSRGDATIVTAHRPIRRAVRRKATRYGEIEQPFVIAVNATAEYLPTEQDILDALYGDDELLDLAAKRLLPPSRMRDADGAWRTISGPVNTRVSGALAFTRLSPFSITSAGCRMCYNPWAKRPLASGWIALPEVHGPAEPAPGGSGELAPLLGLPLGWPAE